MKCKTCINRYACKIRKLLTELYEEYNICGFGLKCPVENILQTLDKEQKKEIIQIYYNMEYAGAEKKEELRAILKRLGLLL